VDNRLGLAMILLQVFDRGSDCALPEKCSSNAEMQAGDRRQNDGMSRDWIPRRSFAGNMRESNAMLLSYTDVSRVLIGEDKCRTSIQMVWSNFSIYISSNEKLKRH
jgi:hypothetical protein